MNYNKSTTLKSWKYKITNKFACNIIINIVVIQTVQVIQNLSYSIHIQMISQYEQESYQIL